MFIELLFLLPVVQDPEPGFAAEVDALLDSRETDSGPGIAVAINRAGAIVYARGVGLAQVEHRAPIDASTPFHVASVTKQFTAMAVYLLEQEGLLSVDDEVRKYITEFPEFDPPIRLRHLLAHTSGLRDQWESLAIAGWRLDDVITTDHVLGFVERQRALNFPPGTEEMYCNTGWTLLAEVVRRVSGMTFDEFCRRRIFVPLAMEDTHVHLDHRRLVEGRAYSYEPEGSGWRRSVLSYANAGATSLFTSAHDLGLWLGNFDHTTVGGPPYLDWVRDRFELPSGSTASWDKGIVLQDWQGHELWAHSGGDAGFRSYAMWFPEHRLGIALVANGANANPALLGRQIATVILGSERGPGRLGTSADGSKGGTEPPRELGFTPPDFEAFEGLYRDATGFEIELVDARRRAVVKSGARRSHGLTWISPNELELGSTGARIRLGELEEGRRTALEFVEGTRTVPMVPVEGPQDGPVDFSSFEGAYWSPELATEYEILNDPERGLVLRHFRHGVIPLRAEWPGGFRTDRWFLKRITLVGQGEGPITGLRVDGSRVQGIEFRRRGEGR